MSLTEENLALRLQNVGTHKPLTSNKKVWGKYSIKLNVQGGHENSEAGYVKSGPTLQRHVQGGPPHGLAWFLGCLG